MTSPNRSPQHAPGVLSFVRRTWQRICGQGSRDGAPTEDHGAALAARFDEAARLWATHIGTAQAQTREAAADLLQGFSSILEDLDRIVAPEAGGDDVDERTRVLASCEQRLQGLAKSLELSLQARNAFDEMSRQSRDVARVVGGISSAVAEDNASETAILDQISTVRRLIEGTVNHVQGLVDHATQLQRVSDTLNQEVGRFRL